jgi:hypothetical protein
MSTPARLRQFCRDDGVYLALMVAFFALRFWPALAHGELYAPFRDNVWLYGSLFSRASEIALTGQFPYWLDTLLGGFPLYQTPHFSATYPFYFFGLLNYGKALEVLYTLTYVTCVQTFILYLNLYVMIRVAGAKGLASLCGASIGLISGNTEIYAQWVTIAAAWSWFPLLVAGMIRMVRAPLSLVSISLVAIAAGMMCTASPSQPVIQASFFAVLFFIAALIWCWRHDGAASAGRLVVGLIVSGVIAVALAAVAFVPMALATGEMIRAVGKQSITGHASVPWASFNVSQLAPHQLGHLLFDSSGLGVLGGIYVGPFALLGVLLCVLAYQRSDSFGRFLLLTSAALALYFLAAGFGTHFGIAYLHFHVPLLNRIREAGRYLVIFTTLVVLLSGIGFQILIDLAHGKITLTRRWRYYLCAATALWAVVFVAALIVDRGRMSGWAVLLILPAAILLLPTSSAYERLACVLLVLLACIASVLSPPRVAPFWVSEYLQAENLASHRVLARLAQIPDVRDYRVAIIDPKLTPRTWANNASFYGIRTFYAMFTPVPLQQFKEMFNERINLRKLRGAKYFIYPQGERPADAKASLLFSESGYNVYEVPDAMPSFKLLHSAELFDSADSFYSALINGFDYQDVAALPKASSRRSWPFPFRALAREANPRAPAGELVVPVSRTPNVIAVASHSTEPGLLILNERWTKDWHARVDSRPVPVLRANFIQPAIALPAGRHSVEFEYKPMLFWYLLIVQRVTFTLLVLLLVLKLVSGNTERYWLGSLRWWKRRVISGTQAQP